MPPSVQWLCVAGSGPKVRPCGVGVRAQRVEHQPRLHARQAARRGRPPARGAGAATSRSPPRRCSTGPQRLVPPPRLSTGAPGVAAELDGGDARRRCVRGSTTPIGHLPVVGAVDGVERAAGRRRSAPRRRWRERDDPERPRVAGPIARRVARPARGADGAACRYGSPLHAHAAGGMLPRCQAGPRAGITRCTPARRRAARRRSPCTRSGPRR